MTTTEQDRSFIQVVISDYLLELAIAWIAKNLSPEDVFSERDLDKWATDNGYVKEES